MEFVGEVLLPPDEPLASIAGRIGKLLGVLFTEDSSGRFEEFPAFTADVLGMELALLGIPPAEEQDPEHPVETFSLLVTPIYCDSSNESEIDLSRYICNLIRSANISCSVRREE